MSAVSSPGVRDWRTAFLTLRDESLSAPPSPPLLQNLIFSNSHSIISAAPQLPSHEVSSDLLFLLESVSNANANNSDARDVKALFTHTCQLVHDVCNRVSLQINSSSWTLILSSFTKILNFLLRSPPNSPNSNAIRIRPVMECLETLRRFASPSHASCSISKNIHLVEFLLHILASLNDDLVISYRSSTSGMKQPRSGSLWEVLALAFTMLGEAFSSSRSSFPVHICQSTLEALRKVMDVLASMKFLVEDNLMSRFYESLLDCLHLFLLDPKCPLSEHVSGFVAALRMFFVYGLGKPQLSYPDMYQKEKELSKMNCNFVSEESKKANHTPYRPPHLRKKDRLNAKQLNTKDSQSVSDHESSVVDFTSSDSDYSDNDGFLKDPDHVRSSKVRVAAIVCLQDLCQADPKSFTTQWTTILPTNDVLKPRKFEATLMTCLLFDPYLKVRIASASTIVSMMDGPPSSVFLQVAEYKESTKYGSFMSLSSSLGLILVQLHTGILYLIQRETHSKLITSLFKILMLLISRTPYPRLPVELLPTVITSLQVRIDKGFPFKIDQTGLLVGAISCLTAALSTSPTQPQVRRMLLQDIGTESVEAEGKSGILFTIFRYSEELTSSTTCFEALQALRAVSHNYPNLMVACWRRVSTIVYKVLRTATAEVPARTWKEPIRYDGGLIGEKVTAAAIKVLDESLRAISGFKGTEDLLEDKFFDTAFTSDCIRTKKISSAPSYGLENPVDNEEPNVSKSGSDEWSEAIEEHIPLVLGHTSAMVRTATVTCFAGITSSAFFSLKDVHKGFIISSVVTAALQDEAPQVRSAACRALGVISCFPEIFQSAEILDKFIHAVETNSHNPLVSVRITASWALANISDSIRRFMDDFPFEQSRGPKVNQVIECALRLTMDGDKVKSNAVRALGNISRFFNFKNSPYKSSGSVVPYLPTDNLAPSRGSCWLEKMVQAFLSCVTTGNVKVQWNVCHAFSNLFLNETIEMQHMEWAPSVFSILLLLLRDSSNFKIRIQAAAALAVPASVLRATAELVSVVGSFLDYGKSFSDIVQGVEHIIENLGSYQLSAPSSFKYRDALEKQLASTMLHVLSLSSSTHHQPLVDYLVKKAPFLEEWFKSLWSSLEEPKAEAECNTSSTGSQKREMIRKALRSLIKVYRDNNHGTVAQRFKKLEGTIS